MSLSVYKLRTDRNDSIIHGTDESELILQSHFHSSIKSISFISMIISQ